MAHELKPEHIEDDDLPAAFRIDPASFELVYYRHCTSVYMFVLSRLANSSDAADLTQQVFLDALHNFGRFRGRGDQLRSWLFGIARNKVADFHRRRKELIPLDWIPDELQPVSELCVESGILREEEVAQLFHCLSKLTNTERELLALRFAGELSTREVAAALGKSETATRQQLCRVLHALREQYDEIER